MWIWQQSTWPDFDWEKRNPFSVRSSLANKLGIMEDRQYPTTEQTNGLANMMVDAITQLDQPLSLERILRWHQWLFPTEYTLFNPVQGGVLQGDSPMQVVSGRIDKPTVHFETPPKQILEGELQNFIKWFNNSRMDVELDPLLRAAITHFWFVTLHPLDDGNGRITRLLTDLALAQGEKLSIRFYAMPEVAVPGISSGTDSSAGNLTLLLSRISFFKQKI